MKHIIEIGKRHPKAAAFAVWLQEQGHELDRAHSNHSYIDGDDILFNAEAQKIWRELWGKFNKKLNKEEKHGNQN